MIVKRSLLLCVLLLVGAGCFRAGCRCLPGDYTLPARSGYLIDNSGVLSPEEFKKLTELLERRHRQAEVEMMVLIVDSTNPWPVGGFTKSLLSRWQVDSNAALIVLAVKEKNFGIALSESLQESLSDEEVSKVVDAYLVRNLAGGLYFKAVDETSKAIAKEAQSVAY